VRGWSLRRVAPSARACGLEVGSTDVALYEGLRQGLVAPAGGRPTCADHCT
jgi:hypothetical protein